MTFNRPEYLFQPLNTLKRLLGIYPKGEILEVATGFKIKARKNDQSGESIRRYRIYDIAESELIYRILGKNDISIDVGANIGYTTALMAKKQGPNGKVFSFEPSKEIFDDLLNNIELFGESINTKSIVLYNLGLSDSKKTMFFKLDSFNRGASKISSEKTELIINLERLDDIDEINIFPLIKLLKIDVEGHELGVLQGGEKLLKSKKIEHIIFEDHALYPSDVSTYLESLGYEIFYIKKALLKPLIVNPNTKHSSTYEPPNYIATINKSELLRKNKKIGWTVL
jgi:FkbM family methyltransferase